MNPVGLFKFTPAMPAALEDLRRVAYNLRWAWDHESIELFRRLDDDLWEATGHNPVLMLGSIDQGKLDAAAKDDPFLAHLDRVAKDLDTYLQAKATWYRRSHGGPDGMLVGYFSAEFGVTECLSIFAGGLGMLAGDHLKAASDMGVPVIGVGLLYQQGYFRQYLNAAGWQQEAYEENDLHNLPVRPLRNASGEPITISVDLPGRIVRIALWSTDVGRSKLYLLDTNIQGNAVVDRDITDQLYGGDLDVRLRQEIVLGVGGYRALRALGLHPTVYHMNEGHSAFLALEHVRSLMEIHGLSFEEARHAASASMVFTTHTPVPAGHDYFPPELIQSYFSDYIRKLGIDWRAFMALGRQNPDDERESFCMTVLALKLAAASNAVSKLHGQVTRRMWHRLWPGVGDTERPIGHVTNGVHFRSWVSYEMNQLYDRYLGPKWREEPANPTLWERVGSVPAEELWRTHERRRERLVAFARRRLRVQSQQRNLPTCEIEAAGEALNPETLTIGFARRFAGYKRATLLLRDPERLARLLNDADRPIQVIYAGKAHPRDEIGKELIRRIAALSRDEMFSGRLVFLEDYDMMVARYLLQGCDVWLNNPRRPLEASGTSGMKALANGVLNLSTLDGWWDEAWGMLGNHEQPVGWAIGKGEEYTDDEYQDQVEAAALYDLLEHDVVQLFYDRAKDGVPRRWVQRMKNSIRTLGPEFNMHRQVRDYTDSFYLPAHSRSAALLNDNATRTRVAAAWLHRVRSHWNGVSVDAIEAANGDVAVGSTIHVTARVLLPNLEPQDVLVELMIGKINKDGTIGSPTSYGMTPLQHAGHDLWIFQCDATCHPTSGLHGYTVRVRPSHPDLNSTFVPGLITWAGNTAVRAAASQSL